MQKDWLKEQITLIKITHANYVFLQHGLLEKFQSVYL